MGLISRVSSRTYRWIGQKPNALIAILSCIQLLRIYQLFHDAIMEKINLKIDDMTNTHFTYCGGQLLKEFCYLLTFEYECILDSEKRGEITDKNDDNFLCKQ